MTTDAGSEAVVLCVRRSHGGVERFDVETGPNTSVLDLLFAAQREHDRSLVFRYSCRIGVCGSCALRVNGREALACRTRALDVGAEIRLEPLRHLPVVRDLAVDLAPFRAAGRVLGGALAPSAEVQRSAEPRPSPPTDAAGAAGDCITCAICYSASQNVAATPGYPGPAAFIRAASLLADPRDGARGARTAALAPWLGLPDDPDATAACPKGLRHAPALAWLRAAVAPA